MWLLPRCCCHRRAFPRQKHAPLIHILGGTRKCKIIGPALAAAAQRCCCTTSAGTMCISCRFCNRARCCFWLCYRSQERAGRASVVFASCCHFAEQSFGAKLRTHTHVKARLARGEQLSCCQRVFTAATARSSLSNWRDPLIEPPARVRLLQKFILVIMCHCVAFAK